MRCMRIDCQILFAGGGGSVVQLMLGFSSGGERLQQDVQRGA